MARFEAFPVTPELLDDFRFKKTIPVHFYNREGQILIYKKENATESEIDRLIKFSARGLYYNLDDAAALGLQGEKRDVPAGLSDTKLLAAEQARELSGKTSELFTQLKATSITADLARGTKDRLDKMFSGFEAQPDALIGLVNILEGMDGAAGAYDVQLAVKRTVVAMAMKTRGLQAVTFREMKKMNEMASIVMMSALFCDIGTMRMTMPTGPSLTEAEMNYIKNHPLMSYLMIAHQDEIDVRVKRNILCHHRPQKPGVPGNNYPDLKVLVTKLTSLIETYATDPKKKEVVIDLKAQLAFLKQDNQFDEDANILAIASEFASLTSKTAWRDAFSAQRAVRMIINNSYFSYADRGIREFLDHVAISLCDNKKILTDGDYIIAAGRSADGKSHYEVCQIVSSSRFQSRPGVDRIATIQPLFERIPKLKFAGFDLNAIKPDKRFAHFELAKDDSRRIVYAVDPENDMELYEKVAELTKGRNRPWLNPPPGEADKNVEKESDKNSTEAPNKK